MENIVKHFTSNTTSLHPKSMKIYWSIFWQLFIENIGIRGKRQKIYRKDWFLRNWMFLLISMFYNLLTQKDLTRLCCKVSLFPSDVIHYPPLILSHSEIRSEHTKCKFYFTASILSVIWNSKVKIIVVIEWGKVNIVVEWISWRIKDRIWFLIETFLSVN